MTDTSAVTEDFADAGPDVEARAFVIDAAHHGGRLDRALADFAPEFSRSYLQQLIEAGAVTIGQERASRSSRKVKAGEAGTLELRPTPQSQAFRPEAMPLDVVHEDEHLLVVNKPPGLVVHPAPGNWSGTLLNGLLARDPGAAMLPRAGIVHRLDKDTSGLMVVARTRVAMDALVRMIAAREVSREYAALAHRPWSGGATRHVDAPIGRDPRNRLRMAVVEGGKPASTTFRLLQDAEAGCWVHATLGTGRTHQIRVHMAHIGHALVADEVYGGAPAAGMARQALHAWRLAFAHPVTGVPLDFRAELPDDLCGALAAWGLRYNRLEWLTSHAPG
ncbi:RluA family pseudouridine synthase [Caenimonas aquaedulcis]|uniref:Pseudouridine synthase n=1 Tax=Caenimonas aquaedulcis TaxID=2793270 RepID=A0A931MFW8_9BURK|nr:RluA family pseudouridine synthase [Caenimonas aquaedulcis]MBG9386810.1 RluA family pseudouridine synthase [Caenimonas aquaedulcis]